VAGGPLGEVWADDTRGVRAVKRKTAAERAWERHRKRTDWPIFSKQDFIAGYRSGAKLPSAKVLHEDMRVGGGIYRNHAEQALAAIRRLRRKS